MAPAKKNPLKHKFSMLEETMIIDFFRENEHLWNPKDKQFYNKHMQNAKMADLSQQLNVPGNCFVINILHNDLFRALGLTAGLFCSLQKAK